MLKNFTHPMMIIVKLKIILIFLVTVQDIDVTFDTIFLKLTNNEFRSIDLKH